MAAHNKTKLIVGLFLVIVAFICLGVLFYYMAQANSQSQQKIAGLQVQLTNLIAEKAVNQMKPSDVKRAAGTPVLLEDLVKKAEEVYGEDEKKQKEGFLWIDKEANSFMVTLGALNGLAKGSRLSVYDGDQKIDEVVVETVLDVIAYVKPQNSPEQYQGTYYRVVIE